MIDVVDRTEGAAGIERLGPHATLLLVQLAQAHKRMSLEVDGLEAWFRGVGAAYAHAAVMLLRDHSPADMQQRVMGAFNDGFQIVTQHYVNGCTDGKNEKPPTVGAATTS